MIKAYYFVKKVDHCVHQSVDMVKIGSEHWRIIVLGTGIREMKREHFTDAWESMKSTVACLTVKKNGANRAPFSDRDKCGTLHRSVFGFPARPPGPTTVSFSPRGDDSTKPESRFHSFCGSSRTADLRCSCRTSSERLAAVTAAVECSLHWSS